MVEVVVAVVVVVVVVFVVFKLWNLAPTGGGGIQMLSDCFL